MRPLVAVRHAAAYDSLFFTRGPLFWPIVRASRSLGEHEDFPPVEALARVFEGDPPVRFVVAPPRRRRGSIVDARTLYDSRITLEGSVPTRARCWHDLMNALVWGTFPRSKLALHARQHRAITERLVPGARALPSARTRELDALALLDEGGVVVLARDPHAARAALGTGGQGVLSNQVASGVADAVVFGHAIYESLVLGVEPAIVAAIVLERDSQESDLVRATDDALARAIEDPTTLGTPHELTRVRLGGLEGAAARVGPQH
jgi:hypothetical protein